MQTGQVVLRIGFYTLAAWGLMWSLLAVGDMSPRDGRGGQAPRQAEAQSRQRASGWLPLRTPRRGRNPLRHGAIPSRAMARLRNR